MKSISVSILDQARIGTTLEERRGSRGAERQSIIATFPDFFEKRGRLKTTALGSKSAASGCSL